MDYRYKQIPLYLIFIIGGILIGLNLTEHTRPPMAPITDKVVKTAPTIIQQVRNAETDQAEIYKFQRQLADKHNFKVFNGLYISEPEYLSFLKEMLNDGDIADQLGAYGLMYMADKKFGVTNTIISIDIRHTPREILEYIESH